MHIFTKNFAQKEEFLDFLPFLPYAHVSIS